MLNFGNLINMKWYFIATLYFLDYQWDLTFLSVMTGFIILWIFICFVYFSILCVFCTMLVVLSISISIYIYITYPKCLPYSRLPNHSPLCSQTLRFDHCPLTQKPIPGFQISAHKLSPPSPWLWPHYSALTSPNKSFFPPLASSRMPCPRWHPSCRAPAHTMPTPLLV